MSYIGLMMSVCGTCGVVAWPFEPPREEEQPDGSVLVYGSLCVCACDPRYTGPQYTFEVDPG